MSEQGKTEGGNKIYKFDQAMGVFHLALMDRFQRIQLMDETTPTVDFAESTYVIPGMHYEFIDKESRAYRIWVGANFERLFFITRVSLNPEEAQKIFGYTFDGAKAVNWNVNFQEIECSTDGAEVSIWATVQVPSPLVNEGTVSGPWDALTRTGAYWAVDIAMMVQSFLRTAQRHKVKSSRTFPAPL